MEKAFRVSTNILIGCLVLSATLHLVLLVSDSEAYRQWVLIQIAIQLVGIGLLFQIRNYSLVALLLFVALSIPFIFINWKFVNYANDLEHVVGVPLFWITYGIFIFSVRSKFIWRNGTNHEERA